MLTVSEFTAMIADPEFTKARAVLKAFNIDFARSSCSRAVIKRVLNDVDKTEIVGFIKKSNASGTDIEYLMAEAGRKTIEKDKLEAFFRHFENKSKKNRLYMLIGETGVGKTYMMKNRFPNSAILTCHSAIDPFTLMYDMVKDQNGNLGPVPTPFHHSLLNGGDVLLDEVNGLPYDTLMFLQGITDEKEYIVVGKDAVRIHHNFKIMATMNPPSETDERKPLGDALIGRAIGFVVELTDEIISQRLNVSMTWIDNVRRIYNHVSNSSMIDVRPLDYRDFAKFSDPDLDFSESLKFKFAVNDIQNIRAFGRVKETEEFKRLLRSVQEVR